MELILAEGDELNSIRNLLSVDEGLEEDNLQRLKDWWQKMPHLPHYDLVGEHLLRSFIVHHKSLEQVKQRIDLFFTLNRALPSLLEDRRPDFEAVKLNNRLLKAMLPTLAPGGYRVCWIKPLENLDENFDSIKSSRMTLALADLVAAMDVYHTGIYIVLDCAHTTYKLAASYTPIHCHKMVTCAKGRPLKIKGIFVFNAKKAIEVVMSVLKPILSEKLKSRVTVTTNDHMSIVEYIPQEIMPEEYGGEAPSLAVLNEACIKDLCDNSDYLRSLGNLKSEENKRPQNYPKYMPDISDDQMEGTFRQLKVD